MPDVKPGVPNPYWRANSLAELLLWHDLNFVRCAFVTVLGRQPDATGEAYYVQRLRAGVSKFEILRQLRRSPEGQFHDPGIAGLDRALKRASWGRLPIFGRVAQMAFKGEPNDRITKLQRAVINELGALREHMNALSITAVAGASAANDSVDAGSVRQERERLEMTVQSLSPAARACFNHLIGAGTRAYLD